MNAGAKLGAYGLVLAAALGGGAGLGAAAGPIEVDGGAGHGGHEAPAVPDVSDGPSDVGGLAVADKGYRIIPEDRLADAGEFAFVIEGPGGVTVTAFDVEHEKRLHLIVASRDLQQFAHVHPALDTDGRWSVDLPDLEPGSYRAFADFRPTGADAVTLGIDLTSPGETASPPSLTTVDTVEVDGYEVALDGDPRPGASSTVSIRVSRNGSAVTTDPYLGAKGHLVALRDGDLAYLHVHPLPDQDDDAVRFAVEVPSTGTYALFFDFSHDGAVHTARFVIDATGRPTAPPTTEQPETETPTTGGHGSDHADGDAGSHD